MNETKRSIFVKKLLYQSKNRGCKETELILGEFADENIQSMSETELKELEYILNQLDADLYSWITNKATPPLENYSITLERLLNFKSI